MTQGDPLYPTIFNVVVDEFLRHWVTAMVVKEEAVEPSASGMENFGRDVQPLAEYFLHGRWAYCVKTGNLT